MLVVSLLVLVVWPWSNQQISELKERFERRGDLERVSPGQFQESASGLRVFFVRSLCARCICWPLVCQTTDACLLELLK